MPFIGPIIIPLAVLSIPIIALVLSHNRKTQDTRLKEMEMQKEILKLEIEKQNGMVKLLEEENKKYDKIIYEGNKLNDEPKA
jgi:hypothetical protein